MSVNTENEQQELKNLLENIGAIENGHFLLSSGKHSDSYVQCGRIFENFKVAEKICENLFKKINEKLTKKIDVVVGPAMGAVHLSYIMSKFLNCKNIFSERENGTMKFRRGFKLKEHENVLIVEDVVTTGKSTNEVIEIVKNFGANIEMIASIINRGNSCFNFEHIFNLNFNGKIYNPDDCILCKNGAPITKPGSRINF